MIDASGRWIIRAVAAVWHNVRNRPALWGYLLFNALVVLAALFVPAVPQAVAIDVIAVAGVLGLVVGVWGRGPRPRTGWWLIAAGAALAVITRSEAIWVGLLPLGWPAAALWIVSLALIVAGLALLGNLAGRADTVDLLDALMIALAVFLILFALVIRPVLVSDVAIAAAGVLFLIGALLIFAMTVRLVFTARLPTISAGLLLLSVTALVATLVSVLVPSLNAGEPRGSPVTDPLWVTYSVLLGAAGLHSSLGGGRAQPSRRAALSRQRAVLLVILAIVVPVILSAEARWAIQVTDDVLGFLVPVTVSVILLILLVTRLALTARLAEQRADQLEIRTDELAESATEQAALERQLRHQAMHDPLTGLGNRIVLAERMEWALTRRSNARDHVLAVLDLDDFKEVNDTFGHPVGDELLVEVAQRLVGIGPRTATLARLGGDEFAVLLEDTTLPQAQSWAEQASQALQQPYHIDNQDLLIGSSIGLLPIRPTETAWTHSEALRDADLALYAAKAAGKNQVVVFAPELRNARAEFTRLSHGLRRAIQKDELSVHYQPITQLATRRIVAVEALLRWSPRGQRPVPPNEFIPVAEQTGTIAAIGEWALRQACRDARSWYEQYGVSVTVNVSARQLNAPYFAELVEGVLRETGLPGDALVIEVTESNLVASSTASEAMSQLERLRRQHIRVAIDDFGTGYSSLSYVARLPVDFVKIDSSFVQDRTTADGGSQPWDFTRAILTLVTTLKLDAVAEGVETLEQADMLRELKCGYAQGFLFAKPMPRPAIDELLARQGPAPFAPIKE